MRRLMGPASPNPAFERRRTEAGDRSNCGPDGTALSPAAIIARAAATVPDGTDTAAASAPASQRLPEDTLVLPAPRPNRRAQRRPYTLIAARMRRTAYTLRHAPVLLLLFGTPLLLWQTGKLDTALDRVGAETDRLYRGARSAMNLQLRHVRVIGRRKTAVGALRKAAALTPGEDVMGIDLAGLGERIKTLPWVSRVVVERHLPDTVVVRLWEHQPIGRFRQGDRTILIGDDGKEIPIHADPAHGKLLLFAGDGAPEAARTLLQILEKAPALRGRIAAAIRRGKRRWDILFDNRVVLQLPESHEESAWLRFTAMERQHGLLARGAVSFDMRLRDRLVIRKRVAVSNTSG
ncbi:MAG: FtsQ-type POTRA domain-containing protein [Bauldia litoralis]